MNSVNVPVFFFFFSRFVCLSTCLFQSPSIGLYDFLSSRLVFFSFPPFLYHPFVFQFFFVFISFLLYFYLSVFLFHAFAFIPCLCLLLRFSSSRSWFPVFFIQRLSWHFLSSLHYLVTPSLYTPHYYHSSYLYIYHYHYHLHYDNLQAPFLPTTTITTCHTSSSSSSTLGQVTVPSLLR